AARAHARSAPQKAAASTAGSQVLARVGRTTITRADFDLRMADVPAQYRSRFTTPEGKREFLNRLVEERVWLEAALRAGVDHRPEVRKQIEDNRRQVLITTLLREVTSGAPQPSDSAVASYYDAHKS